MKINIIDEYSWWIFIENVRVEYSRWIFSINVHLNVENENYQWIFAFDVRVKCSRWMFSINVHKQILKMCFFNEYLWWIFVITWREWNRIFFIYYQSFVFCKIKQWRTFDVILFHIINSIRFVYYILYIQIDEIDFAKNFDLWQIMIESMFDFIWYRIDTRFVRYDSLVFFSWTRELVR